MADKRPLSSFHLLSFDIYGTLIDWETGVREALKPLIARLPEDHPLKTDPLAQSQSFHKHERTIQAEHPSLKYDLVLKASYEELAKELQALPPKSQGKDEMQLLDEEGKAFGASIANWPAFRDTVAAMRKLKRRYKLVPLSNVDRESFDKTLHGALQGVHEGLGPNEPFFDAVYTAQDIGSYKPDPRNFEYLIKHIKDDFGVEKGDILHVAQSLFHDHEPAKKFGLQSAWIDRGKAGIGSDLQQYVGGENPRVAFGWRFSDLGELAEAIEKEQKAKS